MKQLLDYKEQNHIHSEEFLYLLADAGITFGYTKEAEQIVSQLKNVSANGRKAAQILERRLEERREVIDEEDFWGEIYDENSMTQGNNHM